MRTDLNLSLQLPLAAATVCISDIAATETPKIQNYLSPELRPLVIAYSLIGYHLMFATIYQRLAPECTDLRHFFFVAKLKKSVSF